MHKVLIATVSLFSLSGLVMAQAPAPAPSNQLSPQVLGEMLRSATTFHQLVENLNLKKNFGADDHVVGPDGTPQHSITRTAETIGAGAGVGAAIGGMTKSQNGVLIGALVGGAGGLIIDQILKHKEETQQNKAVVPVASPVNPDGTPLRFKERPNN